MLGLVAFILLEAASLAQYKLEGNKIVGAALIHSMQQSVSQSCEPSSRLCVAFSAEPCNSEGWAYPNMPNFSTTFPGASFLVHLEVSINGGSPKLLVYNGKIPFKWMIEG